MAISSPTSEFACPDCDKTCASKSGLKLHRQKIHGYEGVSTPEAQLGKRRRRNDHGGRPPADGWEEKFLTALVKTQLPEEAAKAAGISRAHAYRVRKKDPEFAALWEDAIERGTEILEAVAVRRAVSGSDTLLIFLLKSRRPDVYRENVQHKHTVEGSLTFQLDGKQPIQLDSVKRREAARILQESVDSGQVIEGTVVEEEDEDA